jgi:coniferyl-aldehyde dehydrogenase
MEPAIIQFQSAMRNHFDRLHQVSRANPYFDAATRIDRLRRLEAVVEENAEELVRAMSEDFSYRSPAESRAFDITATVGAIRHARQHVKKRMKMRRVPTPKHLLPARSRILPQPLGVVGVISPWNFPVFLALPPMADAIAAGNLVMLKPSELTPKTSEVLQRILHAAFSRDELVVITGGPDVAAEFSELPFDHLIFTGSTAVGRKVAVAAAKNLTPVTLELGGKSPTIITPSADMKRASRRVAFGKCTNAGQICIAPDYALVPRVKVEEFVIALEDAIQNFYPQGISTPEYSAIISDRHKVRLETLAKDAEKSGARVIRLGENVPGGNSRKLAPTIIIDPDTKLKVMQEEVFGPILSIIPYDTPQQALDFVTARDRPLALYVFAEDRKDQEFWLYQSISGGVCVNETAFHVVCDTLPFGGVGASGIGAYHGAKGFETFSHMKSIFIQPRLNAAFAFDPPLTGLKKRISEILHKII